MGNARDVSATSDEQTFPVRSWLWLLSVIAGGVLSAAYDGYAVGLYRTDHEAWDRLQGFLSPIVDVFSYMAPIVGQACRIVSAAGDLRRALLVENLYAMDWLICLVAAIGALPFIIGSYRMQLARERRPPDVGRFPNPELERQQGLGNGFFALAATFCLWESWFGSWGGTTSFFNHVEVRDADFYRLCLFVPLTLMMGTLPLIRFCVWCGKRLRPQQRLSTGTSN